MVEEERKGSLSPQTSSLSSGLFSNHRDATSFVIIVDGHDTGSMPMHVHMVLLKIYGYICKADLVHCSPRQATEPGTERSQRERLI